jgi:hypothetical protein
VPICWLTPLLRDSAVKALGTETISNIFVADGRARHRATLAPLMTKTVSSTALAL